MLEMNPEIVCQIIQRAREFQSKETVVLPDAPFSPGDDLAIQTLADHADDMTYREVKDAIDDLEPDQQVVLVALMWLGRGDYDIEEWSAALEEAESNWTERTSDYILATPLVADYLLEGLDLHDYTCD
jgi:hypothetical protein